MENSPCINNIKKLGLIRITKGNLMITTIDFIISDDFATLMTHVPVPACEFPRFNGSGTTYYAGTVP